MLHWTWTSDDGEYHSAERLLEGERRLRAVVQSLGGAQWDWQVWDESGRAQQRYGLAETLEAAKARAERAVAEMLEQRDQAGAEACPQASDPAAVADEAASAAAARDQLRAKLARAAGEATMTTTGSTSDACSAP